MKRVLSIVLTLCMMLSLFTTFVFALESDVAFVTVAGGRIDIYSDRVVTHEDVVYHNGSIVITGYIDEYFLINDPGTYDITFYDFKVDADWNFFGIQLNEDVIANMTFCGVNEITSNLAAFFVGVDAKAVVDIADNSSLKLGLDEAGNAIQDEGVFEMKDGSALPEPDENDTCIMLTNGVAASVQLTYEYVDDDKCNVKHGEAIAVTSHICDYSEKGDKHDYICVNCKHVFEAETHILSYDITDSNCVPYCVYCSYEGEKQQHKFTEFMSYDDEHCIKVCEMCGYGDEENGLVKHDLKKSTVAKTEFESEYEIYECKNCSFGKTNYSKKDSIYFELMSYDSLDWENSAVIVFKNGEPFTLARNFHGHAVENYAIPYDKDASYSFVWLGRNLFDDMFGLKIYYPDKKEPVFTADDMSEYVDFEVLYESGVADYTKFFNVMDSMPESFEYYTKASVAKLEKEIKKIEYLLPKKDQKKVDDLADSIKTAIEGLVETEVPTSFGLINLTGNIYITDGSEGEEQAGYYLYSTDEFYEYDGDYTIFCASGYSNSSVEVSNAKTNITTVGLYIEGVEGNFCIYNDSDVELTALGTNVFFSQMGSTYAGIEVEKSSKLTITDKTGSIIAIGDEECAGIGSYWYSDNYDEDYYNIDAGEITVNGGVVFAVSTYDGAGIGGAYESGFEKITINGGRVYAECLNEDGAGIGGGDDGEGGDIIINGGDITALSLDDDGAGIGAGNGGYVDSITINGGNILVGTDDAARIGGGESSTSYGGKITINGGIIRTHVEDSSTYYIGNDGSNERGEDEDNFVQINDGNILGDGYIVPAPADKDGNLVVRKDIVVSPKFADKEVTIELSNGKKMKVVAFNRDITVYIPEETTVVNEKYLVTGYDFEDVEQGRWYHDTVYYAAQNGLMTGISETEFAPNVKLNRATFVTILAKVEGVYDSLSTNVKTGFSDVPKGKWYAGTVKWAAEVGVTDGVGGGKFAPLTEITREQMCTMFGRYLKYAEIKLDTTVNKKESFKDDKDISSWAKEHVYNCQMAGIVNGMGNGKFEPKGTATRAQAASIFAKFHASYLAD